jgi:hypothetical protein
LVIRRNFRVEPSVSRELPHRPGRAQLMHPVPQYTLLPKNQTIIDYDVAICELFELLVHDT